MQLGYADLKADADGVITATLAEAGQVVAIGQAVARLAHQGEKEAVVALPETWLGEARKATATVRAVVGARPQLRCAGCASSRRRPTPRPAPMRRASPSRTTDDSVAFGMTATVRLSRLADGRVARLPLSAILNRGSGPSVYAIDRTGALVLRPVTVASFTENVALVTSGISDGDQVVTLGVQKLEAGLKVRAVEAN